MTKSDAIEALRALGIRTPSRQLVEDYLRAQQAEEWALELPERSSQGQHQAEQGAHSPSPSAGTERPHPSSESNLETLLGERGELQRPTGRRRAGRPCVQAPWFQAVATVMADGTSLRQALARCGVYGLSTRQVRSLYRSRSFQALYRSARGKYQREWGRLHRRPARRACKGGDRLGPSRELLRSL